jgi:hypothetical protein
VHTFLCPATATLYVARPPAGLPLPALLSAAVSRALGSPLTLPLDAWLAAQGQEDMAGLTPVLLQVGGVAGRGRRCIPLGRMAILLHVSSHARFEVLCPCIDSSHPRGCDRQPADPRQRGGVVVQGGHDATLEAAAGVGVPGAALLPSDELLLMLAPLRWAVAARGPAGTSLACCLGWQQRRARAVTLLQRVPACDALRSA